MGLFSRSLEFFRKKKTFTAEEFLFKFLSDGSSVEMNKNGSGTPKVFEYVVPVGKALWLRRLNMCATNGTIDPDNFFGRTALPNGLEFKVVDADNNVLIDFLDGQTIKQTIGFANLAGVDAGLVIDRLGAALDGSTIRWTIAKAGEPLYMKEGQKFRAIVNDDLTTISSLRMMLQGLLVDAV